MRKKKEIRPGAGLERKQKGNRKEIERKKGKEKEQEKEHEKET